MSYKLSNILLVTIFVAIISFVTNAHSAQAPLKIQIDLSSKSDDKNLQSKLNTLAKEIENAAKLYQTSNSNQKAYWELEGRKSILALLRSEGYYSPTIDPELSNKHSNIRLLVTKI